MVLNECAKLNEMRDLYSKKFAPEDTIFGHIHRGDRIFIGTACGEPQHMIRSLKKYV